MINQIGIVFYSEIQCLKGIIDVQYNFGAYSLSGFCIISKICKKWYIFVSDKLYFRKKSEWITIENTDDLYYNQNYKLC